MFGLYLLVLVLFGNADRFLYGFLAANGDAGTGEDGVKSEDYGRQAQMDYFNHCVLRAFPQKPEEAPPTIAVRGMRSRSRSIVAARAGSDGSTFGTAWNSTTSPDALGRGGVTPAIPGSAARIAWVAPALAAGVVTCSAPVAPTPKASCTRP